MPHPLLPLVKAQINLDHDLDDALLEHKIATAEAWCATFLGVHEIPAPVLTEAVLQLAAYWYAEREAVTSGPMGMIPFGVHDLLRPYAEVVTGHVSI
ncbi:head-tail connector protein [Roseivivax sp. THAF197b]|uniref:head-tail connector protein n=1 Tax=Roseivivax sp. THAF197b TaxID=2588299 RepID=UPI001268F0DD|nr:head-tail connector protein [Roseivivax sp. THAF197b]QFS82342.1 Phage gp6-like head-tail connector protein [Roseivivax sp. THAF197b]